MTKPVPRVIDHEAIHALLSSGFVVMANNPNYAINRDGEVWRVRPSPRTRHRSIPRKIAVINVGRSRSLPYLAYHLAGWGPPWKNGIRTVTIRTLLRENFPTET